MKRVTLKLDNGNCIDAIIIASPTDKAEGFRKFPNLEGNQGLLFVYEPPAMQPFWNFGVGHKVTLICLNKDLSIDNIYEMRENSTDTIIPFRSYGYYLEVKPEVLTNLNITDRSKIVDIIQ